MSQSHPGDRGRAAGRGRLVLLRGGRDARETVREDADWQAFCGRIGWREPAEDLSAEDEHRIVRRVLEAIERDNTRDPGAGLARVVPPPHAPPPVAWAQRVLLASAMLAMAAAVCLIVAATLSWPANVAARAEPATPRATSTPRPAEEPSETSPNDAPKERAPAPRKKAPIDAPAPRDVVPAPPGAIAARRDDASKAPSASSAPPNDAGSTRPAPDAAPRGTIASSQHARDEAPSSDDDFSTEQGSQIAFAVAPLHTDPANTAEAHRAAWNATVGGAGRATPVSWSISPAGDRWYGASLPPAPAQTSLPGGVGVVAQLDIGKALAQF